MSPVRSRRFIAQTCDAPPRCVAREACGSLKVSTQLPSRRLPVECAFSPGGLFEARFRVENTSNLREGEQLPLKNKIALDISALLLYSMPNQEAFVMRPSHNVIVILSNSVLALLIVEGEEMVPLGR